MNESDESDARTNSRLFSMIDCIFYEHLNLNDTVYDTL